MKTLIKCLPLLLGLWLQPLAAAQIKPYEGNTPALSLQDLQGQHHSLEDYRGKVVLLQFWATYCTPCRQEMPSMNRLQQALGDEFVILAVNMAESDADIKAFLGEVAVDFTVLKDPDGKSIANWKVFAAPSNFIIDRSGTVRYTLFGGIEWDSAEIKTLISELP